MRAARTDFLQILLLSQKHHLLQHFSSTPPPPQITYWETFDGTAIRMLDGSEEGEVNALAITKYLS